MAEVFGSVEAGGTKFVCGVGTGPDDLATITFPTTEPGPTIARAIQFFRDHWPLQAIGIGSFGPLDLRSGKITSTPKDGWANTDFAGRIAGALKVPVGFDTDVNAAALGEWRWGAARGLENFVFLTVGTGIGGGAIVNGKLLHGMLHPEMGHIKLPHHWKSDPFQGVCPYHSDCLEGLAAGPAMARRWGQPPESLPPEHPAWALEAHYLALALATLVCVLSPERIVLGGGVMEQRQLFPLVRQRLQEILGGYLQTPQLGGKIGEYIVPPALGQRAGILGAIALAQDAVVS